jgi:Deoxyribose-phosphate aldolase
VGQGEGRVSSLIRWGDGPDKGFLEQPLTGGGRLKIKASGSIRTKEQVLRFLSLGAERIGTSATFDILS